MNVLRLNRATFRSLRGLDATVQMPDLDAIYTDDEEEKMRAEGISDDEARASLTLAPSVWRIPIQ